MGKKHKKKNTLPMEKASGYGLIFILTLLVLWITLAITSHSGSKYSGKTYGEVTDIFFVMPNMSGCWDRKSEVSFSVNGQTYKIHVDGPASIQIGDSCKVKYHPKRPVDAFVEWY